MVQPANALTATEQGTSENATFPPVLVWAVIVLAALPTLFNWMGVDFSAGRLPPIGDLAEELPQRSAIEQLILLNRLTTAESVHVLLEWSAMWIALVTVVFAFTHYNIKRDVTTPIIGTALFFSGMLDGFHTLGAARLIDVQDAERFIPFTWALSRACNAFFLILGAAPFLSRHSAATQRFGEQGLRFIVLWVILFSLMAWTIIISCAAFPRLPVTIFPYETQNYPPWQDVVHRPWELIALSLYLAAGAFIFPRFRRMHPSLLAHGLLVSVIPHMVAQIHAAFFSTQLYDNHFHIAQYEKILAYTVPLVGLIIDYTRAYHMELTLQATAEKLRVARDVQQGLLPQSSPELPGFDVAGASTPTDAVGGDYFDYVPMLDGKLGIVVADVSGHEIGASILLAETRAYVRALVQINSDAGETVTQLNHLLGKDLQKRWFVTMFFVQLDIEKRSFVYTGAGHEGYLIDALGQAKTLKSTGTPLGVQEDGQFFCSEETKIHPGDILVALTDGIVEAKAPDGKQFGAERVWEIVRMHRDRSAREIVAALNDAVRSFCHNAPLLDDVTIVIVKENSRTSTES